MVKCAASVVILVLLSAASASGAVILTHCIKDCTGVNSGDYNSCDACAEFVTCSGGTMTKTPCAKGTFFDSDKGKCDWTSNTCTKTNSTSDPTTAPRTTAQTPDSPADVKTFLYVRVQYHQTFPCVSDDHALTIVPARTKVECAIICNRTTKCWYFQHTEWQCWLYAVTPPPCYIDVYRYDG